MIKAFIDGHSFSMSSDLLVGIYQELNSIIKSLDETLSLEDVFSEITNQFLNENLESMIFKEFNVILTDVHKNLLFSPKGSVALNELREVRLYSELSYVLQWVIPISLQFIFFILLHDKLYDQEKEALLTKWSSFTKTLNCLGSVSSELAHELARYREKSEQISAQIRYKFHDLLVERLKKRFSDLDREVISRELDGFLIACIYSSFLTAQSNLLTFELHVQLLEGSITKLSLPSQAVCKKCLMELLQNLDDEELGYKQFDEYDQMLLYNQLKKHYDSIDVTDDCTQWEIAKKSSLVREYSHLVLSLLIHSLPDKIEILCRYYKCQSELYLMYERYVSYVIYRLHKERADRSVDKSIDIPDDLLVALFDGIMHELKHENSSFINQLSEKEINTQNSKRHVFGDLLSSYKSYKESKSAFDNQCLKNPEFWIIHKKFPVLQFNSYFEKWLFMEKEKCRSRFESLGTEAAYCVIDKSNECSDKAVTLVDNHVKSKKSFGQKIKRFFTGKKSRHHPVDVVPDTELSSQMVQPSFQIQR